MGKLTRMKPYSQDLRERVIAAVKAKHQSLAKIAHTFGVSESTVDKWSKRWRETKRVAARPFAGGRRRTLRECGTVIRAAVKRQPDIALRELCEQVKTAQALDANPSMMCRELQRLKLRRKKSRSTTARGAPGA